MNAILFLVGMLMFPFVMFFTIKLGVYAFYRGKQLVEKEGGKNVEKGQEKGT